MEQLITLFNGMTFGMILALDGVLLINFIIEKSAERKAKKENERKEKNKNRKRSSNGKRTHGPKASSDKVQHNVQ